MYVVLRVQTCSKHINRSVCLLQIVSSFYQQPASESPLSHTPSASVARPSQHSLQMYVTGIIHHYCLVYYTHYGWLLYIVIQLWLVYMSTSCTAVPLF